MADPEETEDSARLDVWLWRARMFRTRTLSATHIRRRGVRITRAGNTRRIDKPGISVTVGDVLTFGRRENVRCLEILGLGVRRGPTEEAEALYRAMETDT